MSKKKVIGTVVGLAFAALAAWIVIAIKNYDDEWADDDYYGMP